jgi:rRNA biogenesis protein RRP5
MNCCPQSLYDQVSHRCFCLLLYSGTGDNSRSPYPHGTFVLCRVLAGVPSKPLVDVSLRTCRIEGDLDDDAMPEVDETTQAYVVSTNKKGCFLRLGRQIEGRVILKELCDGFLPDPAASFPMGRLVVGKIKAIQKASKKAKGSISCKFTVDLDMRETVLLDTQKKLKFEEVELGDKHKGTVTRIEDYGVFVRLENSDLSGLVHKSECSDNYIKDLAHLYDPGDLVKVLVLKKDAEKKQFGFSMKASHFENDEDSDDDEDASLADNASEDGDGIKLQDDEVLDSDDENFASKLAIQMEKEGEEADSEAPDGSDSESEDDDSSSDDDSDEGQAKESNGLDTNVGFDWGGPSSAPSKLARKGSVDDDEDSSDEEDNEDAVHKSSHKSRRKQAQRRREEQETSRREIALADGTADDNPETTGDFERLLAGSPNSSEIWIRYMAFHLTLADIPAAREVAERAFKRIEFRQEREKLNVWCALLTLELKYGSSTSLQDATDRACQHNNPKQVYLRVSEIMEREISPSSPESIERADELFRKMCKKFKDKKQVWIAHVQYLLRSGRHEEAHALSKRALESLPSYKHVETMSKFAQLVFEYGTAERARTLFDGLLLKHQKRLDIFFVYVDKEVKHGEIDSARSLFQRAASPRSSGSMMKLADKQMKSLFKKWYSFEEQHGDDETQERVKNAAREYVERSSR